jgi:ribosomal protein S18 acetylase RimI-like enzyme
MTTAMREVSERGGATRRDANPERVKAFRESGDEVMETYFNQRYGLRQIHLQILGTHPDYQRHGHGSTLCRWGMDKAREDDVALTLIASPMGKLLYLHLEFRLAGSGVIEIPGDPETNSWDAMDWDPKTHSKSEL